MTDRRRDAEAGGEVTDLLGRWHRGDQQALERLLPLVYSELRARARLYSSREQAVTLQPTEIVHETFLRLAGAQNVEFSGRAHFLAIASRLMRQVLVDHARARNAGKRAGRTVQLDGLAREPGEAPRVLDVLAFDQVLTRLGRVDAELERVIELRVFGGLTVEETAQALAVSASTVKRSFASARAWLWRELSR